MEMEYYKMEMIRTRKLGSKTGGGSCCPKPEAETVLRNWYGASTRALDTASASDFGPQLPPLTFEGSFRLERLYISYIHSF